MKRINFNNSSICWITKQENSIGVFNIESVLRINPKSIRNNSTLVLSPAVLAGHMYSEKELVADPPYLFQIACNPKDHVIFRTYLHSDYYKKNDDHQHNDRASQTSSSNSKKFKSITLNILTENASTIDNFDGLYAACQDGRSLSGKIEYKTLSGREVEVEFPVKHINLLPNKRQWQMETGPVLLAVRSVDVKNKEIGSLSPCFVHANRFDHVYITTDFPFNIREIPDLSNGINCKLDCKMMFLVH